jgi:hypothetical protein
VITAPQLDTIPFYGTDLLTVWINDKPYVVLRPAFEAIGLDADQQIRKLQRHSWASTVVTTVQVGDQRRKMVLADVRTFLMALATIPATRVKAEVRPLLEAYQSEVADVIEAYYDKGMSKINPRVQPEQLPAVMDHALASYRSAREQQIAEDEAERAASARVSAEQVRLLGIAVSAGLVDEQWGKTKAQVILARGFGEVAAIPREQLPLYVEDFMKTKGIPRAKITRFSGAFGKKIVGHAILEGTPVPGKRTQEMPDGTVREVTAWTKEHLPLFDRAWNASYANDERLAP